MILIRPARPDEVEKLQDVNDAAFADNSHYDPDIRLDWAHAAPGIEYFRRAVNDPNGCMLVAEEHGKLAGYLGASPKTFDDRRSRYVEIDNLGVIPDYRRRGVGKMLLDACLSWAKDKGFEKAHLRCYSANIGALEFYKRSGFRSISVSLERKL